MISICKSRDTEITSFFKYNYDAVGNLISQIGGGGNLVTGDNYYREYNGLGQLQRVREGNTASGNILEEYFYDSNGDRIRVNRYSYTGGTNETIYTPYREWMQIRNSSGTHNFYYIYQGNVLVARLNADGTKWFYHPDHLGSTSLITDESGNVVEDEFYSPFGESLSVNEDEDYKLYTGQFKDSIQNQYYYGTRYYNPFIGKFIQCDKIKPGLYNPQQLNCYSYGLNNPFKYFDWNGQVAVIFEGSYKDRLEPDRNSGVYQIYQQLDKDVQKVTAIYGPGRTAGESGDYIRESLRDNPNQPVIIIGHSVGGGKALEVQEILQNAGIAVDKVYTIDPFSPLDENHRRLFESPPTRQNVNVNYHQTNTPYFKGETLGEEFDVLIDAGHFNIDSNQRVQREIVSGTNSAHFAYSDRFSSQGGKPIISKDGKVTLGMGGQSGSFKCYASSCSASKAYYKKTSSNSKGGKK